MKFQLSREKFETLEADAKHSGAIKEMHENDEFSGTITTSDVTLSYNYDTARQELNFEVGARHSLAAHMASDNVIYNHVVKVLSSLTTAPPPTNVAQPANKLGTKPQAIHVPAVPNTEKKAG